MRTAHDIGTIRSALRSRAGLVATGWTDRQIRTAVRLESVRRVHQGWYVAQDFWDDLYWEQQHLAHVAAVMEDAREEPGPVACHESAAVVHGLPLFGRPPDRVHVLCSDGVRASSTRDVLRHREAHDADDIEEVDGIRCTTLARSVVDVARSASLETAVSCADAALRSVAEQLRDKMRAVLGRMSATRGARKAAWVLAFADGRAQLPGESVSRLRLVQLGFVIRGLQVGVPRPDGGMYYVDIDTDDWWFEFDGKAKYLDESMRKGVSIEETVLDEKKREDVIRASSGRRLIRATGEHIVSIPAFAGRLAAYGIHSPTRRPRPEAGPSFG